MLSLPKASHLVFQVTERKGSTPHLISARLTFNNNFSTLSELSALPSSRLGCRMHASTFLPGFLQYSSRKKALKKP